MLTTKTFKASSCGGHPGGLSEPEPEKGPAPWLGPPRRLQKKSKVMVVSNSDLRISSNIKLKGSGNYLDY